MTTVREVEDRDLIHLAEFLPKGFSDTTKEFWLPLFEMWWKLNPAFTEQFPRGWIIEQNNLILGFLGNIPTKFLVRGEIKIAAASNSWYVDPSVRGILSIRLFNEFMKQKNVDLFLFKAEDESLRDIMFKYKFEEHILPLSQKEYFCIIDKKKVKSILKLYFLNNQMPKLSLFSEYFKRLGYLFFTYLYQKPVIRGGGHDEETYISSLCASCDDTFYNLWKPKLNICDATLSRDTKTLNWLYFSSARQYKRVVIQCHRTLDKTLAGYMVFDLILTEGSEVGSLQLVDMCIENNDQRVMASLTSFAIKLGKQNNVALIIVWANSPEAETYFRSAIPMRSTVQHYRYIRFSDTHKIESGRDNCEKVCMSDIYPPQ